MAFRRSLGLLGALAILVSACSQGSPTTPPGASGATGSQAPGTSQGTGSASADLKLVLDGEPTYFSNAYNDVPTGYVNGAIYSALYRINNKAAAVADMATDQPQVSADGLTWTVKIKDGIKFQDGSPLTADDVVFSFQLAMSPNCTFSPSWCTDMSNNVAKVAASDPSTAVFTLKQKYAPFLVQDLTMFILPKAAVMASFAKFQAAAGKADAAAIKTLDDKIAAATDPTVSKECDGSDTQPATCNYSTYISDLEAALTSAGIPLGVGPLNKALYRKTDENGNDTGPDDNAYGSALYGALHDLNTSLQKTETDQVAAAFRLLDFQQAPIGAGPFAFDSYTAGQSVSLKAWDGYYAGKVNPPHMLFPIIKDNPTAAAALVKGDVNWVYEIVSADALTTLQNDSNTQLAVYASPGFYSIAFNIRPGHIYSDINLRKAFSECIDHDATVKQATDDQGVPLSGDIPPSSWAFDPNLPKYTLDVADAKKLIESSGWSLGNDGIYAKGNQKLSTTLYVRIGRPQRIAFAQSAATQLKDCGIEIKVLPSDFSTVLLPLLDYPNKYDTYLGGFSTGVDPDNSSLYTCKEVTTKEHPTGNNYEGYCNKQVDDWINQALQTTDQATRKDLYSKIETQIHNDYPNYFLWADKGYSALSKKITGGTNTVATDGTIDLTSPYYSWNFDAWSVSQ
jgi:ABC-type transport system substrate-binding protein